MSEACQHCNQHDTVAQLRADLADARIRSCACGDDQACAFAAERDQLRAERDALLAVLADLSLGVVEYQHHGACYAPCDCAAFAMRAKAREALAEVTPAKDKP